MKISPEKHSVVVTRDELERLYVKHDFDGLLANTEPIEFCREQYAGTHSLRLDTTQIVGLKYRPFGKTAAVIMYYTHLDGTVTRSIRMLLINGISHTAPELHFR